MLSNMILKQKASLVLSALLLLGTTGQSQKDQRPQPTWLFGGSAAANFNYFRGTTQTLNDRVSVPTAFHKGSGVKPYLSLLTEYRPNKRWGGMLNVAFDNRGGKFNGVMAPCDCPANLNTNISYLTIEPAVRLAPFSSAFYLFAGPTLNFNIRNSFTYTQDKQPDRTDEWSNIRNTSLSAQAGAGYEFSLSPATSSKQLTLAPFVSFLTDIGHQPRSTESWSFYTIRTGVALKWGKVKAAPSKQAAAAPSVPPSMQKELQFSVRAPIAVPASRKVNETFALRNSVFFDNGSANIPARYVVLNTRSAASFNEARLQDDQPKNLTTGRSARQLAVYHNILNILGDRMRTNPGSSIILTGAAAKNPAEGKQMAENIKQYLVTVFGVEANRIATAGRNKPSIPSEQPGATKELILLREGDRRVDIESSSPELLLQVGGTTTAFLKPVQITAVQEDPLDSHMIFTATGADDLLRSWSVNVTDAKGGRQTYGPFITEKASISGRTILGNNTQGNYKIELQGITKDGSSIRRETSVNLVAANEPKQEGLRYSILFDFDKASTVGAYDQFLTGIVTPLITNNSRLVIHGHTDIIGDEKHNHTLSHSRAVSAKEIIERAVLASGKTGVTFETFGFGENAAMAPFENNLPEERFYNRTVIIDIIPGK